MYAEARNTETRAHQCAGNKKKSKPNAAGKRVTLLLMSVMDNDAKNS